MTHYRDLLPVASCQELKTYKGKKYSYKEITDIYLPMGINKQPATRIGFVHPATPTLHR